jgi:hypothetical protein
MMRARGVSIAGGISASADPIARAEISSRSSNVSERLRHGRRRFRCGVATKLVARVGEEGELRRDPGCLASGRDLRRLRR